MAPALASGEWPVSDRSADLVPYGGAIGGRSSRSSPALTSFINLQGVSGTIETLRRRGTNPDARRFEAHRTYRIRRYRDRVRVGRVLHLDRRVRRAADARYVGHQPVSI